MLIQLIGSKGMINTVSPPDVNASLIIDEDCTSTELGIEASVAKDCCIEKEILISEAFDTLEKVRLKNVFF